MSEIIFPAGSTCEVYAFGWTSDGCTDDTGVTRGFTQEWYFDAGLAAWVSVSKDAVGVTGPTGSIDLDIAGQFENPSHLANTGPDETDDFGTSRKFVVLANDGSLTLDYVKTPDLIRPSDIGMDYISFDWTNRTANDLDYSNTQGQNGFTLCGPSNYLYEWNNGSSDVVFTIEMGSGLFNTPPPGFTVGAVSGYESVLHGTGWPKVFPSGTTGTNQVQASTLPGSHLGISSGAGWSGPTYDWVKFQGSVLVDGVLTTKIDGDPLKTENYFYVFATGSDIITTPNTFTGSDIPIMANDGAGAHGVFKLLPQGTMPGFRDHSFDFLIGAESLGSVGDGYYVYVAMPTRVELEPGSHLFITAGVPGPQGFSPVNGVTLEIVNAYGHTEDYIVYRSDSDQGVPDLGAGMKISKS